MAAALAQLPIRSFAIEVEKTRRDVASLTLIAAGNSCDPEKRIRLAYRLFHLASLTVQPSDFDQLELEIATLLEDFGAQEDICLIKANVAGRFHRVAEMSEMLRLCPVLAGRAAGHVVAAEIDFQQGRYRACHEKLLEAHRLSPTWDVRAHLAHWTGKFGDPEEADHLYARAANELSAKEIRSYAWLQVQRAELSLARGLLPQAEQHARRAELAFPGAPKNFDLRAKLLAATGNLEMARITLESESEFASRPELHQAIGELLTALGREDEAKLWFDRALKIYRASAGRGEVHYWHHLADFYADSGRDPAQAVRWARMDLQIRENFSTQTTLAWALLRNDEVQEGIRWVEKALSSGVSDQSVLHTAAELYEAAGKPTESRILRDRAAALCPLNSGFHLHL